MNRGMRLFFALLGLLALLTAGAYGVLRGRDAPGDKVEADIGEAHFSFDPAYARDEFTAVGGFTDRLAFVAVFPDFSSPGRVEKPSPGKSRATLAKSKVLITVALKDDGMDPADRPTKLYARFLRGEAFAGPNGLVMRHFENGSPYDIEELYIAPPDGKEFFARCPRNKSESGVVSELCLSIFRVDGLDVELRYAPDLLEHWGALNEGARGFLARIGGQKTMTSTRP